MSDVAYQEGTWQDSATRARFSYRSWRPSSARAVLVLLHGFGEHSGRYQAFVYGDKRPYCVALIVPDMARLARYAQEQEIAAGSVQELVRHPKVRDFYWSLVEAKQQGLAGFEQVKKIALLDQEFSQASGELTPTLKAKRSVIAQRYESLLNELYQQPALP